MRPRRRPRSLGHALLGAGRGDETLQRCDERRLPALLHSPRWREVTPLLRAGSARPGSCTALVENDGGAPLGCPCQPILGADDGIRTRDPNLGKVVLYQLSYVRVRGRR